MFYQLDNNSIIFSLLFYNSIEFSLRILYKPSLVQLQPFRDLLSLNLVT